MAAHKKYFTEEERLQAHRESTKRWEEAHKEERKEYFKKHKAEYYKSHKEDIAEKRKQYIEEHKAKIKEYQHEYYQAHRDKKLEYKRQYSKTIKGRASRLLAEYNHEDKRCNRGHGDLTAKWIVENIFSKPCAHCGKEGWDVIGCNRLDNSKPHTMDNVEPFCFDCNCKISGGRTKKVI